MAEYSNRHELIDTLTRRGKDEDADARWRWARFLARLDEAGFAIVAKPTLMDVGKPRERRP